MFFRIFLLILLLAGCQSNNFIDWYEPELTLPHKQLTNQDVTVIETRRYEERIKSFTDDGYVVVGRAEFKSEWAPHYQAVEAAMEYGATVVVITSKNVGTVTQNYNIVVPQVNTGVYHTPRGSGTYVGTSMQNVSGSYTSSILEQKATFLAKREEK